jgi:hypothetical protein
MGSNLWSDNQLECQILTRDGYENRVLVTGDQVVKG